MVVLAYLVPGGPESEHPLAVNIMMLSAGCQQAVKRKREVFAQTHFLEETDQNTNIDNNKKFPKT